MHTEVFVLGLAFVRDYSLKRHLHKIVRIVYVALKIVSYILRQNETGLAQDLTNNRIVFERQTCRKPTSTTSWARP